MPNALLVEKRAQYEGLLKKAEELTGKGQLSAEEETQLKSYFEDGDKLKAEIAKSVENDNKVASMKGFLSGREATEITPLSNQTAALMQQQQAGEALKHRVIASQTSYEGMAGHSKFVKMTEYGAWEHEESDGWGLTKTQIKCCQDPTYNRVFEKMMRVGKDQLGPDELKTMSEGLDTGGGYVVPPDFIWRLISRKPYPTRILDFVSTIPCSKDQVVFPRINFDSDTADIYASPQPRIAWVQEKATTTAVDIPFGNVTIPVYLGQFAVELTRNLTEDSAIPIGQIIEMFSRQAYELGMDNVVVSGDGNGKPTGFTTNAGSAGLYAPVVNCGNPVSANGLTQLVYGLPPQYSDTDGVIAVMNRTSAYASFAQIQDNSGQYIFGLARESGPEGMAVARKPLLFGYPVVFSAFMANVGAGNYPLAFGDMRELYTLCQRIGLTVDTYGLQDRSMLFGNKLGWLFRFRVGGMVTQSRAVHIGAQQ